MFDLKEIIAEIAPQTINWRRHIHQNPELGFQEFNTSTFIAEQLTKMGISCFKTAKTGIVGVLEGATSKTVAIRADMDALPIYEESDVPYASNNKGVMHACGHDAHMAIVLGVAAVLKRMEKLPGNVKLIFQPCEERLPGGAKTIIEEGILENPKVDAMFGLHVYPELPVGVVGLKTGAIMAATDIFTIEVTGQGGHGAAPHTAIDPILSASYITNALQSIVSRKVSPTEPAVVTIGTFHAGERPNIIPQKAILGGTARAVSKETRAKLKQEIHRIVENTAHAHGTQAKITYEEGHGPLINNAQLTQFIAETINAKFGAEAVFFVDAPSMGGEDFASYAELIPANYMFFGAATKNAYPWHHPSFDIDEKAIPFAVEVMSNLILEYLGKEI